MEWNFPYVLLADFDGTPVVFAAMCLVSLSTITGLFSRFFFSKSNRYSCDLVLCGLKYWRLSQTSLPSVPTNYYLFTRKKEDRLMGCQKLSLHSIIVRLGTGLA